jgi:hypothetical protein
MNASELCTVAEIAEFTKNAVKAYRHDEEEKVKVIMEITLIFAVEAEGWKKVIDMGKFRSGFTRVLGRGGMKALKKLLYELDKVKYQKIDFGIEE